MEQCVLSLETIFDHLLLGDGSVEDAMTSLMHAHDRALSGVPAPAGEVDFFRCHTW